MLEDGLGREAREALSILGVGSQANDGQIGRLHWLYCK